VNIFYVSIRTTENYQFDKFRTAGVTANAIRNSQGQGDNPVCSTRVEILQPSRPFSPRAATGGGNNSILTLLGSACDEEPSGRFLKLFEYTLSKDEQLRDILKSSK